MSKIQLNATLSKNSFKDVANYLEEYKKAILKGTENGIKKATERAFDIVKANCYAKGINAHTDQIKAEYNEEKNEGKVYTGDEVLIFNEMGTGITGKTNPHPSSEKMFSTWKYDVNQHGEKGWYYPKDDGSYGWTKGLPSRHMFYDTFNQLKDILGDTVSLEIRKTTGNLYNDK